jgi:hypothetical protein
MGKVKRVVIGPNKDKRSTVLHGDSVNEQQVPGIFWRSTLWATEELPVDNSITGDRAVGVIKREPEGDRTSTTGRTISRFCKSCTKR